MKPSPPLRVKLGRNDKVQVKHIDLRWGLCAMCCWPVQLLLFINPQCWNVFLIVSWVREPLLCLQARGPAVAQCVMSILVRWEQLRAREREAGGVSTWPPHPHHRQENSISPHHHWHLTVTHSYTYTVTMDLLKYFEYFGEKCPGAGVLCVWLSRHVGDPTADHNKWKENCYEVNSKNNLLLNFLFIYLWSWTFENTSTRVK